MDYAETYKEMHRNRQTFRGMSIMPHVRSIAELVRLIKPTCILDYGSGKGYQYRDEKVHKQWGGMHPICYDVGYKPFARRPSGLFDAIICTDVLEHIAKEDVPTVLADIFSFLNKDNENFVFFSISCVPAKKVLPDGRNAHLTVETPNWWQTQIDPFRRPGLRIRTAYMGKQE